MRHHACEAASRAARRSRSAGIARINARAVAVAVDLDQRFDLDSFGFAKARTASAASVVSRMIAELAARRGSASATSGSFTGAMPTA